MRITKIFFTLGLVLLMAGCGPEDFLNPLYTKNDLVSDPLLPGTWQLKKEGDEGTEVLEFQLAKGGCYTLNTAWLPPATSEPDEQEKPEYGEFNACLVQLGQVRFLDLQPTQVAVEATTLKFHLSLSPYSSDNSPFTPAVFHASDGLFVTLTSARRRDSSATQGEYELRLSPAHGVFRIWIDATTLRLRYFQPQGNVETLSTENLQKFVLQHADDEGAFASLKEWRRKTGGSR